MRLTCATGQPASRGADSKTEREGRKRRNESKRRILLSELQITGLRTSTGLEWAQRERKRRKGRWGRRHEKGEGQKCFGWKEERRTRE